MPSLAMPKTMLQVSFWVSLHFKIGYVPSVLSADLGVTLHHEFGKQLILFSLFYSFDPQNDLSGIVSRIVSCQNRIFCIAPPDCSADF
jgi:hypothetical protein